MVTKEVRQLIKTKLFFGGGRISLDDQINEFLAEGYRSYVDVKFISVDNVSTTQCNYMALLVYKEYDLQG